MRVYEKYEVNGNMSELQNVVLGRYARCQDCDLTGIIDGTFDCETCKESRSDIVQLTDGYTYAEALRSDMEENYIIPTVYTLYSQDGSCLYVGKSERLTERLPQHREKPWWNEVEYLGLIPLPDRYNMSICEVINIMTKRPRYNRDGVYAEEKPSFFINIKGVKVIDETTEVIIPIEDFL